MIAIVVFHVSLLSVWATVMPLYDAPDEPMHFDMVVDAWQGGPAWPGPREKVYHPGWFGGLEELRFTTPDTGSIDRALDAVSADQAPTLRRSWNDLAAVGLPSDTVRNQMAQHPPFYYRLARLGLAVVPGWSDRPLAVAVMAVRLISVLLAAALPALCWWTVARLGGSRYQSAVAALIPAAVPTATHIHSVINNDVLVTVAAGLATMLAVRALTGDSRARTVIAAATAAAVAMLTKAFGLALAPALLVAGLHTIRRTPHKLAMTAGTVLAAIAPVWWYADNLLRYGDVQPQGLPVVPDPNALVDAGDFATQVVRGLVVTFWGAFGWIEVSLPLTLASSLTIGLAVVCAAGIVGVWRRYGSAVPFVLASPILFTIALVVYGAWARYSVSGNIRGVQGRYLLVGLVGMAALVSFAISERAPAWQQRAFLLTTLSAAVALQARSLADVTSHFWAGPTLAERLDAIQAWSAFGSRWAVAVGLAAALSLAWTIVEAFLPGPQAMATSSPGDVAPLKHDSEDAEV